MYVSSINRKWNVTTSSRVKAGLVGGVISLIEHTPAALRFSREPVPTERVLGRNIDPSTHEQRSGLGVGQLLNRIETGWAGELINRVTVARRMEEDLVGPHVDLPASWACAPDRRHNTVYRDSALDGWAIPA
jgi:hypothetical protein